MREGRGEHKMEMTFIYEYESGQQQRAKLLFTTQSQAVEECRDDEPGCIHANRVLAKAKAAAQGAGGGASPAWGVGSLWWSLGKLGTAQETGSLYPVIDEALWLAGSERKRRLVGGGGLLKVEPEHQLLRFSQGSTTHGLFESITRYPFSSISCR